MGVAVVLWGVGGLLALFVRERDDALASLEGRRAALQEYARRALEEELRAALAEAEPRIEAARRDPLLDDSDLILTGDERRVVLPRNRQGGSLNGSAATELLASVRAETATSEDDVFRERLAIAARLRRALAAKDDGKVERAARDLLAHRSTYKLVASVEVPVQLAVLEELAQRSRPDPALMRALLRDGIGEGPGRIEGLQRLLLERPGRFSQPDLLALGDAISRLSGAFGIEHGDFDARRRPEGRIDPDALARYDVPVVVKRRFYVAPIANGTMGLAVDLDARIGAIRDAMHSRSLLRDGESLRLADPSNTPVEPVSTLSIAVGSPAFAADEARVRRRFAGKAVLGVLLGAGAAAIFALTFALGASERRFLDLKSDFVATVSHELRTPIASLRLLAETLEKRLGGMPEARDYPKRILADVDSLSFMVENILSFHRLERGGWRPHLGEVRVADLVEWLRRDYSRAKVTVAEGEDVVLDADPDLLKLLFSNLASNACKYNEHETVEIVIDAKSAPAPVIRFRDNGVGIAEEDREHVFDEFFRGQAASKARGFGLGLAICARIMALHGGEIRVADSGPGGTSFELTFREAA